MSVINKMLQDLDKRQQGHELSNVTQPQVQYLARRRSSSHWLLLCGFHCYSVAARFMAGNFSWQSLQKRQLHLKRRNKIL